MFDALFQKGKIGSMSLRNRIIMPPMYTGLATGGYAADQLINYLGVRAAGGAAMIIIELAMIDLSGQLFANQPALWDDKFIPSFSRLAEVVHKHGARLGVQIGHGGARAISSITGTQPVSCSPIAGAWGEMPRELTVGDIKRLTEAFVRAAQRARKAGIDGVEIHCAHGYLLRQFLSPYSNKRTDGYGGDLRGRARFPLEVMRSVRQEMGNKYPVWFRINGSDYMKEGGSTIRECKQVSRWMVEAGADAVSISSGTYESHTPMVIQPMYIRRGVLVPFAAAVKKVVDVPVIVAGRINTPDLAERILEQKKADFIAMGRALIVDPELPHKAARGELDEIRRCLGCNQCFDRSRPTDPEYQISCTVNAAVGREGEFEIKPASKPKKIMVIGGGPAGMEAARIAAMRGHRVTLYEKEARLGGQVNYAAMGPSKSGLAYLIRFLSNQLKKYGVTVKRRCTVTPWLVTKEKPDAIILATGAAPVVPAVKGLNQANSATANDILSGKRRAGRLVAVIGGGSVGLETAEMLGRRGRQVTVVEMLPQVGNDLGFSFRFPAFRNLRKLGVSILVSAKAIEYKDGLLILDKAGKKTAIEADTVVLAVGSRPNNELAGLLPASDRLYQAGDCVRPRLILEAIAEGSRIGRDI